MTLPEPASLPDIQAETDRRDLAIDHAGVKDLRYPVTIRSGANEVPTVATLSMSVGLPAHAKGTHMSRFVEALEALCEPLDPPALRRLLRDMLRRLDARSGTIELRFPYFVRKAAPVTGVQSHLDYQVRWRAAIGAGGAATFGLQVVVPATSLCPCSKKISRYGAHNQRSHVTLDLDLGDDLSIEEAVAVAERSASCELYGLLKRPDEKYVTERAYDNPKFAEDLVRDVALALRQDGRVIGFTVEVENFESIHNHSAFARISQASRATGRSFDAAAD